jgi:ADP-heptose:LPS heptosyltransferase
MKLDIETARYYSGLGDIVMLAWLAEARTITFHRKRDLELMRLLGLTVDPLPGGASLDPVFPIEVADQCRKSRLAYIQDFLGLASIPIRPALNIRAEDDAWAEQAAAELGSPLVLLFPQVAWKTREWPASYWVDLAWKLKRNGVPLQVMLHGEDPRYANTPSYRWGTPMGKLAALMKRAALVVGNDSFPAHLAGTVGVPTLALIGPTRPTVFAHMPDVECLAATTMYCTGCHFQEPFRPACDQGCMSLYRLFPDDVLRRAHKKLTNDTTQPSIKT